MQGNVAVASLYAMQQLPLMSNLLTWTCHAQEKKSAESKLCPLQASRLCPSAPFATCPCHGRLGPFHCLLACLYAISRSLRSPLHLVSRPCCPCRTKYCSHHQRDADSAPGWSADDLVTPFERCNWPSSHLHNPVGQLKMLITALCSVA